MQDGRGIIDHFHLHGRVEIEVGTLSKAFGVMGGFVAGSRSLIDYLRQKARPFLFSSALTPPDVAACIAAVEVLTSDFHGNREAVRVVVEARPDYFNHNVETVPRLYDIVRPGSRFERSIAVLREAVRH